MQRLSINLTAKASRVDYEYKLKLKIEDQDDLKYFRHQIDTAFATFGELGLITIQIDKSSKMYLQIIDELFEALVKDTSKPLIKIYNL